MKENIAMIVKKTSIFLLFEIILVLIVTTLLFLVKIPITPMHLPIITLITIGLFWIFYRKDNKKINVISIMAAIFIFAIITLIEGKVYDTTPDGNTYHKLAIGCMRNGWNPCYESTEDFDINKGNVFDTSEQDRNTLWADHYAKATEIFAAVVYDFTGNIESGKGYTLILMVSTFGILFSYLYINKKRNLFTSFIIPFLLVFNAITIVQIFNYYVDGALMLSILMIIYGLIRESIDPKEDRNENLLILASNILLCINIKFTGIAYAAFYCFAFYVYWLIRAYKISKEEFVKKLKEYTIFYTITVVISVVIVGYSSYTKNFIEHGHPLYPLYGKNHVENMVRLEQPSSFEEKNHLEIFLISIFSKGENVSASYDEENIQPTLKIPFTILDGELNNYNIPDIRIGGFGPLFSVIFITSMIGTIYIIIRVTKEKSWQILIPYCLILGVTAILIFALDGNYWARYIPYFYAVPLLVLSYLLWDKESKIKYIFGIILSVIMVINAFLVGYSSIKSNYSNNMYVRYTIKEFSEYCKKNQDEKIEIKLNHIGLQGVLYNLDDLGIKNYTVNQEKELNKDGYFFKY